MNLFDYPAFMGDAEEVAQFSSYPADVRLSSGRVDPENENQYHIGGGRSAVASNVY